MAPSFLKDLRRRSRASFRTDKSTESSSASEGSTVPKTKSSSTLNSTGGSQTPPSILQSSNSSASLQTQSKQPPPVPVRPQVTTSSSNKRYSTGMYGLGSPTSPNGSASLPSSPYAPRITSIHDGAWVSRVPMADAHGWLIWRTGQSKGSFYLWYNWRSPSSRTRWESYSQSTRR
jgi:hypothetical protein